MHEVEAVGVWDRVKARVRPWKDPWSASTHFAGAWLSVLGAVWLAWKVRDHERMLLVMSLYGLTLVLLFAASSTYHFFDVGERGNRWLRRVDHAAIFLVIAGTCAPVLALVLDGPWREGLLWAVGLVAATGIVFKTLWIDCPSWLGASIYIAMGALPLLAGGQIVAGLDEVALGWLVAGGLAYLVGALVFVTERPDPWPETFGYHEVWHLFVLAGAGSHYAFMHALAAARLG